MTLPDAVRACLGRYAELTGRAGRSEHWWFALVVFTVVVAVPGVAVPLVTVTGMGGTLLGNVVVTVLTLAWALLVLALVLPALAVGVRRLHDTGRSGAWLLAGLVPLVGSVALVVLLAQAGTPGPNRYGTGPAAPLEPRRGRA